MAPTTAREQVTSRATWVDFNRILTRVHRVSIHHVVPSVHRPVLKIKTTPFADRIAYCLQVYFWPQDGDPSCSEKYLGLLAKCPLFFYCSETWIISKYFRQIFKYQISWKSVQWEPSCSMRTDGRTDRQTYDEANSRMRIKRDLEINVRNCGVAFSWRRLWQICCCLRKYESTFRAVIRYWNVGQLKGKG